MQQFTSDPVVDKPSARPRTSDAIGQPLAADKLGPGLVLNTENTAFYTAGGSSSQIPIPASNLVGPPNMQQAARGEAYQPSPDGYQASPGRGAPLLSDWSQPSLQQMMDQQIIDQALLNQLHTQLQLDQQAMTSSQGAVAQLLSQHLQQQQPPLQDPHRSAIDVGGYQGLPSLPGGQWSGHSRSPPKLPSNISSSQLSELSGLKHGFGAHEEKKHGRNHGSGPHAQKGRQVDGDTMQGGALEKLRREIARLHSELERMEKEVARQKSLRETERVEFTDAKDRLKHSWAADREDFARVKSMLKSKNAEHHAQSGRLSQQLKELESVNRGLRDLCARNGIPVPAELEVTHSKHHSVTGHHTSTSASQAPSSLSGLSIGTGPVDSLGASNSEDRSISHAASEASYDSDLADRALGRILPVTPPPPQSVGGSQPPSPNSAANAVLAMVQQLPSVLGRSGRPCDPHPVEGKYLDGEHQQPEAGDNEAAAQAAAQAAAALGQLAAALAGKAGSHDSSRPATPVSGAPAPGQQGLGNIPVETTDLNRMSLQSWVHQSGESPTRTSGSTSPRSQNNGRQVKTVEEGSPLEFPIVSPNETSGLGR